MIDMISMGRKETGPVANIEWETNHTTSSCLCIGESQWGVSYRSRCTPRPGGPEGRARCWISKAQCAGSMFIQVADRNIYCTNGAILSAGHLGNSSNNCSSVGFFWTVTEVTRETPASGQLHSGGMTELDLVMSYRLRL